MHDLRLLQQVFINEHFIGQEGPRLEPHFTHTQYKRVKIKVHTCTQLMMISKSISQLTCTVMYRKLKMTIATI